MNQQLLFEYDQWARIENSNNLYQFLLNIWSQHSFSEFIEESEENKSDKKYQPFLKFLHNEIRANNYVGFIQTEENLVEIYPKVFRNCQNINKSDMLRHIFYWFDYCRKWKYPFTKANLDTYDWDNFNFPELIIYLIADQFLETVSSLPLSMFQTIEEALQTPRGSINFKRYIANSISYGNFHNIECDYESFLFDNRVNRAIKYCARLLMNQTKYTQNLQKLQEVILILDDVQDIPCTSHDIENIAISTFFEEYINVLNSCKLVLNQQLYSSDNYDFPQWCLLFPMEYIFEDYVAGFLDAKFSETWKVEYQKSDKYLSNNPKAFKLKHDIFLTYKLHGNQKNIIIDTKYKIRSPYFKDEIKKGVLQSDLYQMTSYAFRRGCSDILLLYPNLTDEINDPDTFIIESGFDAQIKIKVTALEIPFWSMEGFDRKFLEESLQKTLKTQLDSLL